MWHYFKFEMARLYVFRTILFFLARLQLFWHDFTFFGTTSTFLVRLQLFWHDFYSGYFSAHFVNRWQLLIVWQDYLSFWYDFNFLARRQLFWYDFNFFGTTSTIFGTAFSFCQDFKQMPLHFFHSTKGRKRHQCNLSILLPWYCFVDLKLFQSRTWIHLQKDTAAFVPNATPWICFFFHWTQISSLLGLHQAFPFDSVWGSEDQCCETSHMLCILFLFPPLVVYLTIIPQARVGYEMIDSQRGARVGYNHLISNKREWNNCFIKNASKL